MDLDLIKWLNMVYGALEEQDADRRADLLISANSFLEQKRGVEPVALEMSAS